MSVSALTWQVLGWLAVSGSRVKLEYVGKKDRGQDAGSLKVQSSRKEVPLIHVTKPQLTQVEYLLDQSAQGNHVLFDADDLRRVFRRGSAKAFVLSEEEAYEVEPHLERLIQEPSLERKRAYLEALDRGTFERVVRTYFSIVENNIYENLEVPH